MCIPWVFSDQPEDECYLQALIEDEKEKPKLPKIALEFWLEVVPIEECMEVPSSPPETNCKANGEEEEYW